LRFNKVNSNRISGLFSRVRSLAGNLDPQNENNTTVVFAKPEFDKKYSS
jgi:hypothetical protein